MDSNSSQTYYERNKDKIKKKSKEYRLNNKDKIQKYEQHPKRREQQKLYQKEYRKTQKNKEYKKFYELKRKYNIDKESFYNIINLQQNKCAICHTELDMLSKTHIDHSHDTNEIRGVLCLHCNTILGHCKDRIDILESAINYLKNKKALMVNIPETKG